MNTRRPATVFRWVAGVVVLAVAGGGAILYRVERARAVERNQAQELTSAFVLFIEWCFRDVPRPVSLEAAIEAQVLRVYAATEPHRFEHNDSEKWFFEGRERTQRLRQALALPRYPPLQPLRGGEWLPSFPAFPKDQPLNASTHIMFHALWNWASRKQVLTLGADLRRLGNVTSAWRVTLGLDPLTLALDGAPPLPLAREIHLPESDTLGRPSELELLVSDDRVTLVSWQSDSDNPRGPCPKAHAYWIEWGGSVSQHWLLDCPPQTVHWAHFDPSNGALLGTALDANGAPRTGRYKPGNPAPETVLASPFVRDSDDVREGDYEHPLELSGKGSLRLPQSVGQALLIERSEGRHRDLFRLLDRARQEPIFLLHGMKASPNGRVALVFQRDERWYHPFLLLSPDAGKTWVN